jgi:hypothetical protein
MARVQIRDGDWFVEHDWRYRVRQAIRITSQMVFYIDTDWNNKEKRVRLDAVVFSSSDQKKSALVAEQLTSSDALCDQERASAKDRCRTRNQQIIADATALPAAAE